MNFNELMSWINFIVLNLSIILSFLFYGLSVIPITREEKIGKSVWRQSNIFRILSDIIFLILIITIFMWIWFPIPVFNWKILNHYYILIILSILISMPSFYILIRALKDAGKETIETSKETQMYGGIYKHIRHPQISGSILMFCMFCFIINTLFLLIWIGILMICIVPIVIHFEEKDLIKKFGQKYLIYKKNTGALFPKFWQKT
ncbi:MAG: methyltransferase family protein [Candidatus Hodarchaeota archaeon]